MTTSRTLWVIFCCAMAAMWALAGFLLLFTIIVPLLALIMVPGSLLAILIPIGTPPRRPVLPPCGRCGFVAAAHVNGWCPAAPHPPVHPPRPQLPRSGGGWR